MNMKDKNSSELKAAFSVVDRAAKATKLFAIGEELSKFIEFDADTDPESGSGFPAYVWGHLSFLVGSGDESIVE